MKTKKGLSSPTWYRKNRATTISGVNLRGGAPSKEDSPMKSYVGLDVHSKSSVFVIQNGRGEELGRGEVPTSAEGF
jgi:hypothetical protein